jgi:dihydroorotase
MKTVFRCSSAFIDGRFQRADILASGGIVEKIGENLAGEVLVDLQGLTVFPGLVDVHVHLREPGFSHKETIRTGTEAALAGGFTAVCPMPNLDPAPDSFETLKAQLDLIARDARARVVPYGAISQRRGGKALSDMRAMADFVAGFSDDGSGVDSDELMRAAMVEAKALGKIIAAHAEDKSLIPAGCVIHDGAYAWEHGIPGIPSESEWRQVARDLDLVRETGCAYHVCHVSARETVALIRRAKAEGLDVSCETAPHYIAFDDSMLEDSGDFKMNPPIRGRADREALIGGLLDGTVDMIATDHAPHAANEKAGGLRGAAMGVVGLETAFAAMYTALVRPGILTLEGLAARMAVNPGARFGLGGTIRVGARADFAAFDLSKTWTVEPENFRSMGRSTPFRGAKLTGKCVRTILNGEVVFG